MTSTRGAPPLSKTAFLLRLVGICAGVNNFVAQEKEKDPNGPPPDAVADELEPLIGAAVANAPDLKDGKLEEMVARFRDLVRTLRASSADTDKTAAAKATQNAWDEADRAAVDYGMPHLKQCNERLQQAQQTQQWQQVASMPLALQQMATAVVSGRIWVVGGLTATAEASDRVFSYDPVLDKWTLGPPLPTALHHATAVAYRNELVVIGGWNPVGAKVRGRTSAQVLLLKGDQWTDLAPLHHPRAAAAAAVVGDQIVVVGGQDSAPVATTEVFDGSSWHDRANIPVPGDHLAAVSDGKALYAIGGRKDLDPNRSTAALQRYDPAVDAWTRLADMLTPRGGLGAAYAQGRIWAVGGETINSAQAVVEAYDVTADSWASATELSTGRHGLGVAVAGGMLYAIGGATEAGHSNSSATVLGLSLSGSSATSSTSTTTDITTSTPSASAAATSPDLSTCPEERAVRWGCLSSARLRADGGLAIRYRTNFAPSTRQDPAYQHLHVFTAKPDGRGGTIPAVSTMQGDAGTSQGTWVSLYSRDVTVIPPGAKTNRAGQTLDTRRPLLCVRVASGYHTLAKDRSGGPSTGNCVAIQR